MDEAFRWDKRIAESLREEAIRNGHNMDEVVKAAYTPTIRIQAYGNDADFGEYNKETKELTILDSSMVGDTNLDLIKQHLDEQNEKGELYGHHMLIGIPKEVYQLREKFQQRYE
jgi:hypothetical protein